MRYILNVLAAISAITGAFMTTTSASADPVDRSFLNGSSSKAVAVNPTPAFNLPQPDSTVTGRLNPSFNFQVSAPPVAGNSSSGQFLVHPSGEKGYLNAFNGQSSPKFWGLIARIGVMIAPWVYSPANNPELIIQRKVLIEHYFNWVKDNFGRYFNIRCEFFMRWNAPMAFEGRIYVNSNGLGVRFSTLGNRMWTW